MLVTTFTNPRGETNGSDLELAVLGLDVTNRASYRAHHCGFGLDHILAKLDAREQRTVGDTGRGEQAVALYQVLDRYRGSVASGRRCNAPPPARLRAHPGADIHVDPGIVRIGATDALATSPSVTRRTTLPEERTPLMISA